MKEKETETRKGKGTEKGTEKEKGIGKGIRNLIVDFGGVLIDLDRQRCIENFSRLGVPDAEAMLDVCHQQGIFLQYEKGTISSAEFRDAIRERYVVYLLSNTNDIHWRWSCEHAFRYRAFRAEDFFEKIFLSYEMKLSKPDVAIYRKVLDETGINPEETLFIDDSAANCRAAETLGISTYTPKVGEDWSHMFDWDGGGRAWENLEGIESR